MQWAYTIIYNICTNVFINYLYLVVFDKPMQGPVCYHIDSQKCIRSYVYIFVMRILNNFIMCMFQVVVEFLSRIMCLYPGSSDTVESGIKCCVASLDKTHYGCSATSTSHHTTAVNRSGYTCCGKNTEREKQGMLGCSSVSSHLVIMKLCTCTLCMVKTVESLCGRMV